MSWFAIDAPALAKMLWRGLGDFAEPVDAPGGERYHRISPGEVLVVIPLWRLPDDFQPVPFAAEAWGRFQEIVRHEAVRGVDAAGLRVEVLDDAGRAPRCWVQGPMRSKPTAVQVDEVAGSRWEITLGSERLALASMDDRGCLRLDGRLFLVEALSSGLAVSLVGGELEVRRDGEAQTLSGRFELRAGDVLRFGDHEGRVRAPRAKAARRSARLEDDGLVLDRSAGGVLVCNESDAQKCLETRHGPLWIPAGSQVRFGPGEVECFAGTVLPARAVLARRLTQVFVHGGPDVRRHRAIRIGLETWTDPNIQNIAALLEADGFDTLLRAQRALLVNGVSLDKGDLFPLDGRVEFSFGPHSGALEAS
ncbi:MAG TPA: hypothetical protein QGF58_27730 [Myxococcota bacterium]|nr:hypothetical protein [Myxococcota bacterium]